MQVSVVFPAYNEEENIERVMHRTVEALLGLFESFEIIIVDDASTDHTGEMAEALAREFPEIRVLHNEKNLGSGASTLRGFALARGEVVTHDAMDYPFDLRDLSKMLPLLQEADIVVAVRTHRPDYTLYRKLMSAVHLSLLHFLFSPKLRDYNFVQLYRKSVLDAVEVKAHSAGFVTPEIMIRAHDLGFRIKEIEIEYYPREHGVATSGNSRVILASVRDMVRFWWWRTCKIRENTPA